jgi:DNA-binding CsgD family transcriptional regulator
MEQLYVVLVNVSPREWCFRIDQGKSLIGRSQTVEIPVPPRFRHVSRVHAELFRDKLDTTITDLGSSGRTTVNGMLLEARQPVKVAVRDRIRLAEMELELVSSVPLPSSLLAKELGEGSEEEETSIGQTASAHLDASSHPLLSQVSPAEIEVLMWMTRGFTTDAELGKLLYRSPHTVRTQVASIFYKLGIHSRAELIGWLRRCASPAT